MIDVHTHILPAVDDGSQDMDEALTALENGVKNGVTTFVLTPHLKTEADWAQLEVVQRTFRELKTLAADRVPGAEIVLGAEVLLTPWLPERIGDCPAIAVNGGDHVLIELPLRQLPIYADDVLYRLLLKNIVPVLAHPERYTFFDDEKDLFAKWIRNGVLLQVNSGSLTGKFGFWVKRRAARLIKAGMAHLVGSDVHSCRERYDLREGMQQALQLNAAMTPQAFHRNAERVIGRTASAGITLPARPLTADRAS